MMIRDNGDMKSESDRSDCEGMPPLDDSDADELALPVEESLVIRRTLFRSRKTKLINKGRTSSIRVVMYKARCVVQL
jgi:hypothetical protein